MLLFKEQLTGVRLSRTGLGHRVKYLAKADSNSLFGIYHWLGYLFLNSGSEGDLLHLRLSFGVAIVVTHP